MTLSNLSFQLQQRPRLAAMLLLPCFALVGLAGTQLPLKLAKALVAVPTLFMLGMLWTMLLTHAEPSRRWWYKFFALAFGLHVVIALGLEIVWPSFEQRSDAQQYNAAGKMLMLSWQRQAPAPDMALISAPGYIYLNAWVYYLFGYTPLLMKLLNALFGSMAVIYTVKLGEQLFDRQTGRLAGVLTLALPSISFWTSQNLKDSSVLLLSIMVLWSATQVTRNPLHALLLVAATGALLTIRRETGVGIGLVVALTFVLQYSGNLAAKLLTGTVVVLALGWMLSAGGYGFLGSEYVQERFSLEEISARRNATAYGGSALGQEERYSSAADFALSLPLAVVNFLLRPWPWEATNSLDQLMTIPESLIWYPLFALALWGMLHIIRTRHTPSTLLWVYALAATAAAAPQYGNLGTAYRHRVQIWPCFLILAAVGISLWRQRAARLQAAQQQVG